MRTWSRDRILDSPAVPQDETDYCTATFTYSPRYMYVSVQRPLDSDINAKGLCDRLRYVRRYFRTMYTQKQLYIHLHTYICIYIYSCLVYVYYIYIHTCIHIHTICYVCVVSKHRIHHTVNHPVSHHRRWCSYAWYVRRIESNDLIVTSEWSHGGHWWKVVVNNVGLNLIEKIVISRDVVQLEDTQYLSLLWDLLRKRNS